MSEPKKALLMCFLYRRPYMGRSEIPSLLGTNNDIKMMSIFAKDRGIKPEDITILTDVERLPREARDCRIKYCEYPNSTFVCSELCQFIENTTRSIDDSYHKGGSDMPQVLIYISCHGSRIKITIPEERDDQAIVLLDDDGSSLSYLTTKDIFDIIFGRIYIHETGNLEIPIYRKIRHRVMVESHGAVHYEEQITSEPFYVPIKIASVINSPPINPLISPKPYRSSYLKNRGIPPWSKVLFIVDACHSAHMTNFPYEYSPRDQSMIYSNHINVYPEDATLPYCVCISSCEVERTTKSPAEGSLLTQLIFTQLGSITGSLNFQQLSYYILNSGNSEFNHYIVTKKLTPVISSTINSVSVDIPFFSFEKRRMPRKIVK